jgi:hypothetical protein
MTTMHPRWAYAIATAAGAIGWVAISEASGRREAWDSELYFTWFLPSLALIVATLAFFARERAWRWAFVPFGAQALVAFVQNPTANLLPMGLVVFAFYGAICLLPVRVGTGLRQRLERSGTPPPAVSGS